MAKKKASTKKVTTKKTVSKKVESTKVVVKKETVYKLPKVEKDTWVALISDNGEELLKLVVELGYWPGIIISNKKDVWHSAIAKREAQETNKRKKKVHVVNAAQSKTANFIHRFARTDDTIVTINGWDKKIPTEIKEKYQIAEGRPVARALKKPDSEVTRHVEPREFVDVDPKTLGEASTPAYNPIGKRPTEARKWIALFSQTGSEIANLAEILGFWPDVIFTNNAASDKWDPRIREFSKNKGKSSNDYKSPVMVVRSEQARTANFLHNVEDGKDALITLHGWLKIIPPEICELYQIVNGHPGLITQFPDLKGKDPQQRWWMDRDKYNNWYGSVVHDVIAEVDAGKVHAVNKRRLTKYEEMDCNPFEIFKTTSLYAWVKYFTKFPIK